MARVDHYQLGLHGSISSGGVAHGQRDRVGARRVVDYGRILVRGSPGVPPGNCHWKVWAFSDEAPVNCTLSRPQPLVLLAETGGGLVSDDYRVGSGTGAAVVSGGQDYRVSTVGGVGMARRGMFGSIVAKIPGVGSGAGRSIGK